MKKLFFICILLIGIFLRGYKFGTVPSSLHEDEVGVGYNAYTLLTTGRDEHGARFPIALREDAPPMIFYAAIPSIAILGLTDIAVRLPSMIVGILTLVAIYWLGYEIGNLFIKRYAFFISPSKFALLSMLFLAITPWHIQLTRIVHGAEYALLLQTLAVASFFTYLRTRVSYYFYLSSLCFSLGFYPYHSTRLSSPLFFILLLWFFRGEFKNSTRTRLFGIFLAVLIALPVVTYVLSTPLSRTRFGGVNILIGEKKEIGIMFRFPLKLFDQFLTQINPKTLFVDSSTTRYFYVKNSGLLLATEFLLFIYASLRLKKTFLTPLLIAWIVITTLPGALTQGPLNAGRIAGVLPAWTLFSSIGLILLYKQNKYLAYGLVLITVFLLSVFMQSYFNKSPLLFSKGWQYGLNQAVLYAINKEDKFDKIIFDRSLRQAYIYVLFYGHKPLTWVLEGDAMRNPVVGYKSFHNYEFRTIDWERDLKSHRILLISPADKVPEQAPVITQIMNLQNTPVISLVSNN